MSNYFDYNFPIEAGKPSGNEKPPKAPKPPRQKLSSRINLAAITTPIKSISVKVLIPIWGSFRLSSKAITRLAKSITRSIIGFGKSITRSSSAVIGFATQSTGNVIKKTTRSTTQLAKSTTSSAVGLVKNTSHLAENFVSSSTKMSAGFAGSSIKSMRLLMAGIVTKVGSSVGSFARKMNRVFHQSIKGIQILITSSLNIFFRKEKKTITEPLKTEEEILKTPRVPVSARDWAIDVFMMVALIAVCSIYFFINVPQSSMSILQTAIDGKIMLVPIFSIAYLYFLPWLWITLCYLFLKRKSFRQIAYALIMINLFSFCVCTFFQTYIPRNPIQDNSIFADLLRFIYDHDQPYNGFPSLHSAMSASLATCFVIRRSKWSWFFIVSALLIIASTLFTKQHFVLDAISGVGLGVLVTWVVYKMFPVADLKSIDSRLKLTGK